MHANTMMSDIGPKYGTRGDGTPKGRGYLGELKRPNGNISTERSIAVTIDGEDMDVPTLIPTLTQEEVQVILGGGMTDQIIEKAMDFAQYRMSEGKSPFALPDESPELEEGKPWR